MAGRPVSFTLYGGETLTVARENLQLLCSLLWGLAPEPGAISTAALVQVASRHPALHRCPYDLTPAQSDMLREAVALIHAREPERGKRGQGISTKA
jgi:hypothetical protein